ncbi:MAG: hypothetical protein AAFQ14_19870, partial [Cyanobacteria bacterium J06621_12]
MRLFKRLPKKKIFYAILFCVSISAMEILFLNTMFSLIVLLMIPGFLVGTKLPSKTRHWYKKSRFCWMLFFTIFLVYFARAIADAGALGKLISLLTFVIIMLFFAKKSI